MRTLSGAWVLACAALLGCPGASDDGGAGEGGEWTCGPPTGSWQFSYAPISGDCGQLSDEVVSFDVAGERDTTITDQDCESESSGDVCAEDGSSFMSACDATIPGMDGVWHIERTAFLRRTGPDTMEGRYMTRLSSGSYLCTGLYAVEGSKL